MTKELANENNDNFRSQKEILNNMNLLKLKSPEGAGIVPKLVVDCQGELLDATFADYYALLNMSIYGMLAEYPDFNQ